MNLLDSIFDPFDRQQLVKIVRFVCILVWFDRSKTIEELVVADNHSQHREDVNTFD